MASASSKALATLYRPKTLDEVVEQDAVVKILKNQIKNKTFRNTALFCGPAGTGKTTTARAFAHEINKGNGKPIEIDAASNNGVDNIREIIAKAQQKALDCEYKVFIVDECVSGDTEVLTDKGFKRFDSLSKTEKIAQYNCGNIEFVTPTEYIEREYSGMMYKIHIGNKGTFIMSPNHVQPLYYNKGRRIRETYVKDTHFCTNNRFTVSGCGTGKYSCLSELDKLAIVLQSFGVLKSSGTEDNQWIVQLMRGIQLNRFISILKSGNIRYEEIDSDKRGYKEFIVHAPKNITSVLSTYFCLENMDYEYANEFIEELIYWDRYHIYDSKYSYYTSEIKDNIDFCQAVSVLGTFATKVFCVTDKNGKNAYKIRFKFSRYSSSNNNVIKEEFPYNGKIYCVKVPSKNIVIRRDGIVIITGNCHAITNAGWQAFLKTLEEPPANTIFLMCTTDPAKLPKTILSRVQRFEFKRISFEGIVNRLKWIINEEDNRWAQENLESDEYDTYEAMGAEFKYTYNENALQYIARLSEGGMRDAITMLDKVMSLTDKITVENIVNALGSADYTVFFTLTNAIIDCKEDTVIDIVESIYNDGADLKQFVKQYLMFLLDVNKYAIFRNFKYTQMPDIYGKEMDSVVNGVDTKFLKYLLDQVNTLNNDIRWESQVKPIVEMKFLVLSRDEV